MENGKNCDCCGGIRDTKHTMNSFELCKMCAVASPDLVMATIKRNQNKKLSEMAGGLPF